MNLKALLCALIVAGASLGGAWANDELTPPEPGREYRIGVEDVLRVVVWKEPELSMSVTVRPDGRITLPLVDEIEVEGRTPREVRSVLTERLGTVIRDPNVTVIVERINSFKVYFIGEVASRGVVQFFRPTRLLHAIATGGGPTEFSKEVLWLIREEDGVEKRLRIDYKKLLEGDPSQENFYLRPGDMLLFE